MTDLQIRIIKRAVQTRIRNGEDFDEIIKDYPKLSDEEIESLKSV